MYIYIHIYIYTFIHIIHAYLPQDCQQFFKPSKTSRLRFKHIGYTNYVAAMAGNITGLTQEQDNLMTKHLISFRHTFTRNSSQLLSQGAMKLKAVKFSFRGILNIVHSPIIVFLDLEYITEVFA